ncbi:NTP transferase domain-containing protein, partial [Candidatus Dojkabacteria bacterium]|nr:NTP transferase domain-containing protein [Candidatus Dojkabacteria bacterium]
MKALILAGGRGTRLRPLTHTMNKHLLPIGNRPMIFRVIEDAIELGINDLIININKGDTELPRIILSYNKKNWKKNFQFIEQPEPNGMMYPIKLAEKLIGNEEFFFSAGDNILLGGLKKHYDDYKKNKADAHILVVKRKDYRQFGVAVIKNGQLVNTVEKPKKYISDLVLTAIYFFKPVVFGAFENIKPIDPNNTGKPEYYPPTVNNWVIKQGYKFTASEVTGWW